MLEEHIHVAVSLPFKNHFKFVIYNVFVFFLLSLNNVLKYMYMYITYGIN